MPLTPGDRLGPYEILGPLGAGGMGEVYKARDAHLNREVAIKSLPPSLANDADYLARFQREAQTLATLHHPNIASIYGLEQNAIVMELAAGKTLRGPLPLSEALPIARQIAEALEAAHEKGIIHRDLKPGNIMVGPDGTIKVLDFGLAKSIERPNESSSNSPTLTLRSTEAGLILGTAGYMSPEQAAGKPVDRRADIWAFGVVFYELLTGQRLFDGETVSHTLADVLRGEIDFTPIPSGPIRDLIQRCLDRNIKTRLQHIAEARIAIDIYLANPNPAKPAPTRRNHWPWAVAVAGLAAATIAWSPWLRKPAPSTEPTTFEINPPAGTHWAPIFSTAGSVISPDGRTLAFLARNDKGQNLLHVRRLDSLEARPLPGTENASRPFWSHDSKSLAFGAGGKLKRIDLAGGSPIALCDLRVGRGGTWNEEGVILFSDQLASLQRISASGGTPAPVTQLNKENGESAHYYPQFLPGGRKFLYHVRSSEKGNTGIYLGSLDGAPPVRIVQSEVKALYDAFSRRLLYMQDNGRLMAQTLELDPPRLTGDPVTLAEDVGTSPTNSYADFSISSNGALLYGRGGASGKSRFVWRDRAGKSLGAVGQPVDSATDFALSPDDSRVAYVGVGASQADVWVQELARGLATRITFEGALRARWSPRSDYVYYTNGEGLNRKPADGSGEEELVHKGSYSEPIQAVAPDGRTLLYGLRDILIHPLDGGKPPASYLQTKNVENGAVFSPDGRWLAYVSDESGRAEVYIQGYPERRGKWLVSGTGGYAPKWRADGKEIFWYRSSDGMIMAASVELQPSSIRVGTAEALFPMPASTAPLSPFAVARNGRFLIPELEAGQQDRPMVVVQNWAARLP